MGMSSNWLRSRITVMMALILGAAVSNPADVLAQPSTERIVSDGAAAALFTGNSTGTSAMTIPLSFDDADAALFETYCQNSDTQLSYSRFESGRMEATGSLSVSGTRDRGFVLKAGFDWFYGAVGFGVVWPEIDVIEILCTLPSAPDGSTVTALVVAVKVETYAYDSPRPELAVPDRSRDWDDTDSFYTGDVSCAGSADEVIRVQADPVTTPSGAIVPLAVASTYSAASDSPVIRLRLNAELRQLGEFDISFTCVSTTAAVTYTRTIDVADLGQVNDIDGQITVGKQTPTFTTLQMTPCPAGSEVLVGLDFDAKDFVTLPSHRSLIEDDVAQIEVGAKTSGPDVIEVPVTVTCESDTQRVTGQIVVKFFEAEDDEPVSEDDTYDSYISEVEGLPSIGSVSISPAVTTLGATVSAVPSGPCPDGTEAVGPIPTRAMGDAFLRGDISDALFGDLSEGYPVGADGNWSVSFTLGDDGLATQAAEIELIFVCGQAGEMTSRYDTASFVVGATEEAAAEFSEEPTGAGAAPEPEAQPAPSTSGGTADGSTSSGGSSSTTPRFEVLPAPALSDGGAGSPSPDSADSDDEAGVAAARLFDFDIERQAIIDTSTGAVVGVYDEVTGNFVSPTDDSLIAVIDPSNGEVTVLASGEVVARVLAAAGDDAGDDDSGDSGSNTLVYVLIGAAALLSVLLGVYWLGARQRGGPPSGTGAAAPGASPTPAGSGDTPPVTQQTPLPPPPPPANPGVPPSPPAQ